jgi:hypothetical protein
MHQNHGGFINPGFINPITISTVARDVEAASSKSRQNCLFSQILDYQRARHVFSLSTLRLLSSLTAPPPSGALLRTLGESLLHDLVARIAEGLISGDRFWGPDTFDAA